MHLENPLKDLIDEQVPDINLNEAPMEQNELQMVVYSPDQATHNSSSDDVANSDNVPQPTQNSIDQARGVEEATRIGMVLLPKNLDVDPRMMDYGLRQGVNVKHADGVRLWAKNFAPFGQLEGVRVPNSWCDFFTFSFLNPSKFEWAKSLLQSRAWQLIQQYNACDSSTLFQLPHTCPAEVDLSCPAITTDSEEEVLALVTPVKPRDIVGESTSTSALLKKKRKPKVPMVAFEVRRSDRLKAISHGFMGKHSEKTNCLCCSIETPTLSKKVIISLGIDFCKIKPGALSDEALQQKPKMAIRKISRAQTDPKKVKDDTTKKGKKK
jgi:hypothetical protein